MTKPIPLPHANLSLRDLGLQHEVALTGFGDLEFAGPGHPGVTVISHDPDVAGRLASEALFARIQGDDSPASTLIVPTRLIAGGSGEITPRQGTRRSRRTTDPIVRALLLRLMSSQQRLTLP